MPTLGNRPGLPTRPRPPGLVLAVAGVLGLGLVAAAVRPPWQMVQRDFGRRSNGSTPEINALPQPEGNPTAMPMPDSAPPFSPPAWIPWALLAVVVAVMAFYLVRWLRRRLEKVPSRVQLVDEVVQVIPELPVLQRGAEEAERQLLAGGSPTDAIVAAWMALEESAESSGVPRRPAQTPTEFTADVLNRTGVDPGAVQTLLRLYLRARFAATGADADDLESARRCVRTLATSWRDFTGYALTDDAAADR